MQTEQPTNERLVLTRQRGSQAEQRELIRSLCGAADERRAEGLDVEAEPLYLRALALAEQVCAPLEVAIICNNLAVTYKYTGRFDEAERLYRRALALKEKLLTDEHPDVGVTLNNLAVLCKARGRYAEAGALYRRALAIFEQSFGLEHPKVISCRNNYARLLRQIERSPTAEKFRAGSDLAASSATSPYSGQRETDSPGDDQEQSPGGHAKPLRVQSSLLNY